MSGSTDDRFPRSAVSADIGRVVRGARRKRRWSQNRLAGEVGVDRRTVIRLERGLHVPTSHLVCALEQVLDIAPLVSAWPEMPVPSSPCYGPRVRLARRARGVTAAAAAAAAGVSPATWSRFERGASVRAVVGGFDAPDEGIRSDELSRLLGFDDAGALNDFCMMLAAETP